jgi:hypothetical protein
LRVTRVGVVVDLEQYQFQVEIELHLPMSLFCQCRISSSPCNKLFLCRTASVSETAATILLQGLTAHYLATDSKIQRQRFLSAEELANLTQISKLLAPRLLVHLIRVEREIALKTEPTKYFYILKTGNLGISLLSQRSRCCLRQRRQYLSDSFDVKRADRRQAEILILSTQEC